MNGIIILDRANVPLGPFTREQVEAKLQRGEVTLDSPAFVEGLTEWTPLRDVLARVAAVPALPPVPTASVPGVVTTVPGTAVPAPTPPFAAPTPTAPAHAYSYAASMQPPPHLVYAGFWPRVAAHLIDLALLSAGLLAVIMVVVIMASVLYALPNSHHLFTASVDEDPMAVLVALVLEIVLCLVSFVSVWLYFAMLESGPWQGTLGKRVLNLRVTSMSGERISFWHATGRFLARTVAALPFGMGYLMVLVTERKQTLHDMIASTLVVSN